MTCELLDGSTVVGSATADVSGGSASGTHDLGNGASAGAVRLTVTDANGASTSDTTSV